MTQTTGSELALIYMEFVLLGIIATFIIFYNMAPVSSEQGIIPQTANIPETATNQTTASVTDASWITGLIGGTLGLPVGLGEILVVSSIILIPLTIMNSFVAIRIIKDLVTNWL